MKTALKRGKVQSERLSKIKRHRSELITIRVTPGIKNLLKHIGENHGAWNCRQRSPRTVAYHLLLQGIEAVLQKRDMPADDIQRLMAAALKTE